MNSPFKSSTEKAREIDEIADKSGARKIMITAAVVIVIVPAIINLIPINYNLFAPIMFFGGLILLIIIANLTGEKPKKEIPEEKKELFERLRQQRDKEEKAPK